MDNKLSIAIAKIEEGIAEIKSQQPIDNECYVNAFNQYYNDGLKYTNTPDTAINVNAYPTLYHANLYYKRGGKVYVCMPSDPTIPLFGGLTEENWDDVMVEWID